MLKMNVNSKTIHMTPVEKQYYSYLPNFTILAVKMLALLAFNFSTLQVSSNGNDINTHHTCTN